MLEDLIANLENAGDGLIQVCDGIQGWWRGASKRKGRG